jgi:hypothetical protein
MVFPLLAALGMTALIMVVEELTRRCVRERKDDV